MTNTANGESTREIDRCPFCSASVVNNICTNPNGCVEFRETYSERVVQQNTVLPFKPPTLEEQLASYQVRLAQSHSALETANKKVSELEKLVASQNAAGVESGQITALQDEIGKYRHGIDALNKEIKTYQEHTTAAQKELAARTQESTGLQKRLAEAEGLAQQYKTQYEQARSSTASANDYNSLFKKAGLLFEARKYEEAIEAYDKAAEINPKDIALISNKGYCLNNLNRFDEAIRELDKAIELNPNHCLALINKSCSLMNLKRPKEALDLCEKAIKIEPSNVTAWYNKGVCLYSFGKYDEAMAAYDKAIEFDPKHTLSWNNKGACFERIGRLEDALSSYDKAIELNPKETWAWESKTIFLKTMHEKTRGELAELHKKYSGLEQQLAERELNIKEFERRAAEAEGGVTHYKLLYEQASAERDAALKNATRYETPPPDTMQRVRVARIKCPKCAEIKDVTDPTRPLEVRCNKCDTKLLLKR